MSSKGDKIFVRRGRKKHRHTESAETFIIQESGVKGYVTVEVTTKAGSHKYRVPEEPLWIPSLDKG